MGYLESLEDKMGITERAFLNGRMRETMRDCKWREFREVREGYER